MINLKNKIEQKDDFSQDIEPLRFIKSFYPLVLARKIYLSLDMFFERNLLNFAASSAFYFLFSIIPLVLFFVLVLDTKLVDYGKISEYFFNLLGSFNQRINKEFFEQIGLLSDSGKSVFGIVGAVGLIWSSKSVFGSVNNAFSLIFKSELTHNFFINKLISLIFVPLIFVVCVIFFIASSIVKYLNVFFYERSIPFLGAPDAVKIFTDILTVIIMLLITFCLYRFLPKKKPASINALTGALLFTLAAILTLGFFPKIVSVANYYLVYGVISVLIAGLFWLYILFAMFYFFAQFVYVQSNFDSLEIIKFFTQITTSKANIIERILFSSIDTADAKYGNIYYKGQTIFKKDEKAEFIFIVRYGKVILEKTDESGEISKAEVNENEMFGEKGLLEEQLYDKNAYSLENSFILCIPKSTYKTLTGLDPSFSESILNSIVSRSFKKESVI